MRCVIFDVDGTIADNQHRAHLLKSLPKDWDGFFAQAKDDKPVAVMGELMQVLRQHYPVILCTGRMEKYRDDTREWLARHDFGYDGLFMRPDGDYSPDHEVKCELLQQIRGAGFDPLFVVDDRSSVVRMWREQGLVCLQCAEGNF